MRLSDFDYNLPRELIAQEPMKPRDHSRLLILDRTLGNIKHRHFYDIGDYLKEGDVLVFNNTKVFPARLIGKRKETGGKVEVFLHRKIRNNIWECLLGGQRRRVGLQIEFGRGLECKVIKDNQDGTWDVKFNPSTSSGQVFDNKKFMSIVERIGQVPLPPYIKSRSTQHITHNTNINDKKRYQTVYADNRKVGSVAAPTAGFHFTHELMKKLKNKGVQFEYITLHVGLGTFAPVKVDDITKHKMHSEYVEVKKDVLNRIALAKEKGRRTIAVGTTSVRTLEAIFPNVILEGAQRPIGSRRDSIAPFSRSRMTGFSGFVDIFIYPGFKFKVVDVMITNFHLPKSTLLMLVSAFACTACPEFSRGKPSRSVGREKILKVYEKAIRQKYRFYSYGDAMLIL